MGGTAPCAAAAPTGSSAQSWGCCVPSVRGLCYFLLRRQAQPRTRHCAPRDDTGLLQKVVRALDPHSRLDFPALTDIAESVSQYPDELDVTLSVLIATLQEPALLQNDVRNATQDNLKALTILTEIVYDDLVFEKLQSASHLSPVLKRLQHFQQGGMGEQTDANIRMLSYQLAKELVEPARASARQRYEVSALHVQPLKEVVYGATGGVFIQASALGATYWWGGWEGMVGLVYFMTGWIVPIGTGFLVLAGVGSVGGLLYSSTRCALASASSVDL